MFRIKASYADQMELSTTLEKAREFFGELRNFADLMPGIEGIRKEAGGISHLDFDAIDAAFPDAVAACV